MVLRIGAMAVPMASSKIYVTKTARQLLFEGYEDIFLGLSQLAGIFSSEKVDERFGWFYNVSLRCFFIELTGMKTAELKLVGHGHGNLFTFIHVAAAVFRKTVLSEETASTIWQHPVTITSAH